ncbi:MAG: hypothetical protein QNJ47_05870 [Nostocaceae cyanobacterium]|nr:hypothetical protein [Nostocaceae cyanobacterium]
MLANSKWSNYYPLPITNYQLPITNYLVNTSMGIDEIKQAL